MYDGELKVDARHDLFTCFNIFMIFLGGGVNCISSKKKCILYRWGKKEQSYFTPSFGCFLENKRNVN